MVLQAFLSIHIFSDEFLSSTFCCKLSEYTYKNYVQKEKGSSVLGSNICYIVIYKSGYKGGDKGDSPPPEPFQGGDCPPPGNCPPPERFRGGTAKILENVPLLSDSGGGQIFSFRYFHVNSS